MLARKLRVSERRACRVVGQPRSTQRLASAITSDEELALRAWLRDFSRRRPRWGWKRVADRIPIDEPPAMPVGVLVG
jgi:hypothetical protein